MSEITLLGSKGLIGGGLAKAFNLKGESFWCPGKNDEAQLFNKPLGTVYYCIGLTADYHERPFDTIEAHVSLLARILKKADFRKLVYLSSTRLYDSLGGVEVTEDSELRFSPTSPRHLYDISKALGENLCLTASSGRACVVRLACVVGTRLCDDGFIPGLLRQVIGRREMQIDSSPNFARDYIGLEDVARILIRIAEDGQQSLYNLGSGNNIPNFQLFKLIESQTGCVVSCKSQKRINSPLIDISRIKQEFDFEPIAISELVKNLILNEKKI
jgi:UDP-glucose 4-epimerase